MSVRRNTLYNLAGSFLPLAATLITVPIYLNVIGEERYGVLAIVWVLLGYFGAFDLGLSRATARRIAKLRKSGPRERAETFWTTLLMSTCLGAVGALALWPVAYVFFGAHFQMSEELRREVLSAVPWIAAALPVATTSQVLIGALQGRERFLALNVISVAGALLLQLLPLTIAWLYGPDLAWLIPSALLAQVITFVLLFGRCREAVPLREPCLPCLDLAWPLLRYGGWVTVIAILVPLMMVFDRVLIGITVGAAAVAYYAIPYNIALRFKALGISLSSALFPRFSAESDVEAARIRLEAIRVLAVVLTPAIVVAVIFIEPFLGLWLGESFGSKAGTVGQILLVGVWANSFARLASEYIQARGRPDLVAKCHALELVPYAVALFVALKFWGITGAAAVWSIRVAVNAIVLGWVIGWNTEILSFFRAPVLFVLLSLALVTVPFEGEALWFGCIMISFFTAAWALLTAPASVRTVLGSLFKTAATRGLRETDDRPASR